MLWRQIKNSKTTSDAYLGLAIHTYQKYLNPSGDPVPLKIAQLLDQFYL
jgi:hypothetical protein